MASRRRAGGRAVEATRLDLSLVARLLAWIRPYRARVAWSLLLAVASSVLHLAGPLLTAAAIDLLFTPGAASRPAAAARTLLVALGLPPAGTTALAALALTFLLLQVAAFTTGAAQSYLMSSTGEYVMRDLRVACFRKLQRLPVAWFDRRATGGLISRIVNDVETVNTLFSSLLVSVLSDLLRLAAIVVVLVSLSPVLALATFAVLPLIAVLSAWFRSRARRAYRQVRELLAGMSARLQEVLSGLEAVHLARAEERFAGELTARDLERTRWAVTASLYHSLFYPLVELATAVGIALVLGIGAGLVSSGLVSLGVLVAFVQLANRFYRPIASLADNYATLQSSLAAGERVLGLLAEEEPPAPAVPATPPAPTGRAAFDRVWFAYQDEEWVVRDLSLTLEPGTVTALVGPTGAGKTTLAHLLLGFYLPQRGSVLVDGLETSRWEPAGLRRRFAVVLQEVTVFPGTLMENILLDDPEIGEDRAREAALRVGLGDLVDSLPEGWHTPIGEGGRTLSTGEQQLVAFARALARDPEFLILDEATASVDAATEARIQRALDEVLRGRTALVIAHRLHTIQRAHAIAVLHQGRIVELGTHAQLLLNDGPYAALVTLQQLTPQDSAAG